ncbi:uncharacterized protein FJT64_013412 [Amphibalanus amphitrite]|uniref:RNA-directed DNA polymerase n=1 Tax=Amphibalanus amphitrite TaxID=1232801 RepID=A0A6A4VAI8_AMPAM|nr:uncharacterized protein FJT64_013412 [Amphibalanus amphitrite]
MSGDSGPPLPAPFLPHPGTPAVPWRNWEQKFELYLLARCGTSPLPPEQRRALLLCAIGDEAYRVFDTLPPVAKRDGEDDYDVTLRQLREFYTPRTNVIVERFRFRQRAQAPTESTADFVAALRGLARTCQFGPMESELIRDVVVEKTPHQRLRERLLQDRDLTLDKVLSVAETYEDSLREAAAISQPVAAPPVSSVAKVTRKPQQKRQQQQQQSVSSDFCTNCGREDHAPRDAACPARRVTCHSCGKKGHFASWCRGGSGATPARPAQRQHHKAVKELNVLSCAATTGSRLTCTVQVTAGDVTQEVPLQVDTGATCSLLSVNRAKELFRGVAYSPSSSRLYGFGQQPLPVLGTLPTTVTYNNQAVPTNFYLVDTNKTEAIMGMDLLQALGVTLHPASHSVYTYRPGRSIPVADALSRLPLPDTGAAETDGDEIVALLTDDVSDVITDDDVCAASAADPVMEQLRSVIRTGWPDAARQCTPETRDYFAVRNELQVRQDGVVLRGPDRAVVPAALRSKYLQLAHRAHDGVVRTKQLLRDLAWWPGMSKDAAALVADCPSCHAKDAVLTQQARPAPLQPVEFPDRPWSKLGLDIVGPIPGAPPSAKRGADRLSTSEHRRAGTAAAAGRPGSSELRRAPAAIAAADSVHRATYSADGERPPVRCR